MKPLHVVSLAGLLALPLAGQELPPLPLPPEVAATVRELCGREPAEVLARLGAVDRAQRGVAEEGWERLDDRVRCALVRWGLRSGAEDVAVGAAAMARPAWLDAAEGKAAVRAGMARHNLIDTPFDVAEFCGLMDADDVTRLLAAPIPFPREVFQFLGSLHHRLGPEHVPLLCQLARSDDVLLREDAQRFLVSSLTPGPAHREKVAALLVAWPGQRAWTGEFDPTGQRAPFQPRPHTLRPRGEGWSPLLAALLERAFLQPAPPDQPPEERFDTDWAFHWALAEPAGPQDRELLQRLCAADDDRANLLGLRGLLTPGGDDLLPALRGLADRIDGGQRVAPLRALGELVRRGDAGARQRLADLAVNVPLALAVQLDADPDTAARDSVADALGADADAGRRGLDRLLTALDDAAFWGMPLPPLDELAARAAAAQLDGRRLSMLLREQRDLRTAELCAQALAALTPELLEAMPLGVLELHDAAGLAARLRAFLGEGALPPGQRDAAAAALLALRDQEAAQPLWQWLSDQRADAAWAEGLVRWGGLGGESVRERLLGLLPDAAPDEITPRTVAPLPALLAAGGLDVRLCLDLLGELQNLTRAALGDAWQAMRDSARAGDAAAALGRYLGIRPLHRGELFGLGTVRDPAVTAHLEQARQERHHGLYLWATQELARQGDDAARAELERAVAARLYRWIDELDPALLAGAPDLGWVPALLAQVDTNCCCFAAVGSRLEDLLDVDAFVGESGVRTRAGLVREHWQRYRERLRWSRIADRFLVAPR